MNELERKYRMLQDALRDAGGVAIAFSGGVDSTLLLRVAHDVLGNDALAITVKSHVFPTDELEFTREFCRDNGIRQEIVELDELGIPGFSENPPNRCYLCKRGIFGEILEVAGLLGVSVVAEGSNVDDLGDYRPGKRAIEELGVASPLQDVGLGKGEIRELSRQLGLPTWSKPSAACLASRFAYGQLITDEKLAMVGAAERFLREKGFGQVRVRVHDDLARIEAEVSDAPRLMQEPLRSEVARYLKVLGFTYVTLDLQGYRMGSMNEQLAELAD